MVTAGSGPRSHVRVDGEAKVTGTATFAADFRPPNLAHAAVVTSPLACAEISGFELRDAQKVPGVLRILTYRDLGEAIKPVPHLMAGGYTNSSALPLGSSAVHYAGQIVALVVAESGEAAAHAASLVKVEIESVRSPAVMLSSPGAERVPLSSVRQEHEDQKRGDAGKAFENAAVKLDATYRTPIQHHNPMELFGTTCWWQGDRLTVYEASRYIDAAQHGLAAQLGIDPSNIRFLCPYIGGHFGSRLALSQYTAPVAVAARLLKRPVRYVASRSQCFTVANHRPDTQHRIRIASTKDGEFSALLHDAQFTTSRFDNFALEGADVTAGLYAWQNVETSETLERVDRNTPGPMRAPPEVPYLFALESAIDEMAEQLDIDPVELRRPNDTAIDVVSGKSFTPRKLMDCFDAGAKSFNWASRQKRPGSMRDGDWLVGYGCASAVRPVKRAAATVRVALSSDGRALVETAHHEIGNGLYTILAMEAAQRLGLEVASVTVRLGDTALPPAGISGGSSTTTSLIPALAIGCEKLHVQIATAAVEHYPPFASLKPQDVALHAGSLRAPDGHSVKLADLFASLGVGGMETLAEAAPGDNVEEPLAKLRQGKLVLGSPERIFAGRLVRSSRKSGSTL